MKQVLSRLLCVFSALFLVSCGTSPNDIAMSVKQGECLTGGSDGASPYNPSIAPYCMSVTLQNNNTGSSANNVQVTSNGITLSYTALTATGLQTFSDAICDINASGGVCPSGSSQIGNITVYDPNNCATQQGSRVTTLMANGGTCKFYLQIAAESFALGSYPITITYNYTNSNQNYNIATTVSQNVNLYSGGESGLHILNGERLELMHSAENTFMVAHDNYGNVYFNSGHVVVSYNGLNFAHVGEELPGVVTNLTADSSGNLIAVVSGNGLFYYNLSSSSGWQPLPDSQSLLNQSSRIFGISYTTNESGNILYVIESSSAYLCLESNVNNPLSVSCSIINSPPDQGPVRYFQNSLASFAGGLYVGTTGGIQGYNESGWLVYTPFADTFTNDYAASIAANSTNVVFAVNSQSVYTESALFNCNLLPESTCSASLSASGNNISGNISAITLDGAGYIYGLGANINSADFVGFSNTIGFIESGASLASALWLPITNSADTSFNSPLVVSSLVAQ